MSAETEQHGLMNQRRNGTTWTDESKKIRSAACFKKVDRVNSDSRKHQKTNYSLKKSFAFLG